MTKLYIFIAIFGIYCVLLGEFKVKARKVAGESIDFLDVAIPSITRKLYEDGDTSYAEYNGILLYNSQSTIVSRTCKQLFDYIFKIS